MGESRSRVDARRSRAAVLAAAGDLFDESAPGDHVSVEAVAGRAAVGKATVVRAFGDRVGLLKALMVERAADVVERVATGPEPLGPGAPARDRLPAVLEALLDLKLANRSLALALEQAGVGSPYAGATYGGWHVLVAGLVEELTGGGPGGWPASFSAHALLAAVRADLVEHLLATEGLSPDEVRRVLGAHARAQVTALAGPGPGAS